MKDLNNITIKEAHKGLKNKSFSAHELTSHLFQVAAESESVLHAHLILMQEQALKSAKDTDNRISKGEMLGLLDGIPLSIKDNMNLKGYGTTCSSKILSNYISPYDATVVKKLRENGTIFVGKTNLDEFAMGSSTENSAYGPTSNPWNPDYVPGGSSGGSATVVSVGSALGSLGSDTGGSIRQPASFCGVVGFKPTYGSVSRFGLIAFASSLDQIGPFARTAEDAKIIYQAISGHDPKDATSLNVQHKDLNEGNSAKIGVVKELMGEGIADNVKAEMERVIKLLEAEGNQVSEVSLPMTKMAISIYYLIAPAECSANLARFDGVRFGLRSVGNTSYEMSENTRADGFGDEVKRRVLLGTYALSAGYYDAYYGQALRARKQVVNEFNEVFKEVDYLISPSTPSTAFKFGEKTSNPLEMYMSDLCTIPANLAGIPAISIPTGVDDGGMPYSVQLMSPELTDISLLNFSSYVEKIVSFDHLPSKWRKKP
jgi:aspartyl-tRNA(Asn)/glutamyl-tRNA(Gln) amidotransferase subunit A